MVILLLCMVDTGLAQQGLILKCIADGNLSHADFMVGWKV